ncbi:hypothetical protein R1flu_025262 [Riccia fluitans]|uniref:Uncharacterized protein n=1 Tax=Riccia fluitans TaxID=41844 RepID=A0ABD1XXM7_9MARC
MAEADLSRRLSWTGGTASVGTLATSSSSQWVRNERYAELKQLEQEAKKSMKEMKHLEMETRELAAGLEKLKKTAAQRVSKIQDLTRAIDGKNEADGNEKVENQESEGLEEQLVQLKEEHAGIQRTMEDAKLGLERKRGELDRLAGHHKGLCEQIGKEEKALQAAELEESFQQSVAVQHEMRSLSEDLRRLGHLMDGLSPTTSLPVTLKQNPKSQSPRTFRRDVNRGARNATRISREGVSATPSSSRSKEPVEFEERDAFTRKRHKNSSFEQELERLHEQRERLEAEAHQKQFLLESVTRFSSQSKDSKFGLEKSSKDSPASQHMLSPSSVFEGFKDIPSLGQGGPASAESSSASSDVSSEDTKLEKPEEVVGSSVVKRLQFGHSSSSAEINPTLQRVGTGASHISGEEISERYDDTGIDHLDSVASGGCSVGSWSDNVKEQALMMGHGLKEECFADNGETEDYGAVEEEDLTRGSGVSGIDKLEEEVGSWEEGGIQEITPREPKASEHHSPSSALSRENNLESDSEEPLSARCHTHGESVEIIPDSKKVESGAEATTSGLHSASKQSSKQQTSYRGDSSEAAEVSASDEHLDENVSWRYNAESEIQKLSSQLSLLDQKVETEVKLQYELKKQEYLEQSSAASKQMSEQVRCFDKEINELRESMSQLKHSLLGEIESRSIAEHTVQQFQTVCADQSAKLEQLEAQVSHLARELDEDLKLRAELESKLEREARERLKVETDLKDLSQAVTLTEATKEKTEEALHALVQQQKNLLVDQLKEAEKLRNVAEVRVVTLDKQAEQLEMVCDVAQNVQEVLRFQDKILKLGLQTLFQLLMLVICVSSLYSRISEATKHSLIPT